MRRLLLTIAFLMPMILFGQSFDSLWKQVEKASQDDLPQTEQQILSKIAVKAEKEKAYGQLLKAELKRMTLASMVSNDSLQPAEERMELRAQQINDEALRAVYHTVLGLVFEQNDELDDSETKAREYFDQAMANPDMLASVKVHDYVPLVKEGRDSQLFNNDLLSLLGMESRRYDVMRQYYGHTGNRQATLLSTLFWLREQRPEEMEKLEESAYLMRLDSLLMQYGDLQEACEVAIERYDFMCNNTGATNAQKWDYLQMALERWGNWQRANYLRDAKAHLSSVRFSVNLPVSINTPAASGSVMLKSMRGISKMTMRVYRVNATAYELKDVYVENERDYNKIKAKLSAWPEMTQERNYTGKAVYEMFDDTLTLQPLPVGIYLLEFVSSPRTDRVVRMLYHVSGLRMLSQMLPDMKMRYVVVDADTGQPIKGAQMMFCREKPDTTMITNEKGECEYDKDKKNVSEIFVTTDNDKACMAMSANGYFSYYDNNRILWHVDIFTDRSIYRPGQTVHVAAILYQTEAGFQNSVKKGATVNMVLRDANRKEVGKKILTTDDYGTCSASFTLPRQALTGIYTIETDNFIHHFRVEEYKRPTFEVEIPEIKESYADGDTLQVKGTARSYAGVPVQGAKVSYKVMRRRAYWWWSYSAYWNQGILTEDSDDSVLAEAETLTDADGSFVVPTPIVVPKTRYTMFYNFVVTAEVTDQAGETHRAELSLPLGNKKTAFSVEVPEKVLSESNVGLFFHLRNAASTELDAEVRYRFTPEGKRSQDWQRVMTNKYVSLAHLKSGKYLLEAICGEDSLQQEFTVFSLDDKRPATKTDDWFFVSDTQFRDDGTPVTVQVGSSDENVHIVYTIISGKTIIEKGAIDQSNALWNRKLTYKEEYGNGLLLSFAWFKNGKAHVHETTIQRPVPDRNLKLRWETFRDRLEPGQQEEWTLSITAPDGKPAKAQLMATLYDKSLEQLTQHNWSLIPYTWLPTPSTRWYASSWHSNYGVGLVNVPILDMRNLEFNAFDHSIFPIYARAYGMRLGSRRTRGMMLMPMAIEEKVMRVNEKVVEEAEIGAADEDMSLQGSIAGLDVKRKVANGLELPDNSSSDNHAPQVRENLNETAFFYPQLLTDSEGRVKLKFTLPESLTTWRFLGLAHTQDMMTGVLTGETVAKKDVMIMPNVPRFVRMGDKATISARIFNSGEKMISGKARMLLLDPETDEVVLSTEQQVSIAADSMLAVTFAYDTKDEQRSLLVLKMMVSGEDFSDGEQHYLPILPNKERVTVTVPFTQHEPGTKTIDLNSLKPHTSHLSPLTTHLTVEYTNNPAWFMIQALPTVGHPHDNCAICQAASFYANAIGRHILQQNPQAKNVFEAWSRESGSETSLMSGLQKNQELKDLLLDETPWADDANREQEQKERLAGFFDENLIQQRLDKSVENLNTLQLSDGSWSWWSGMSGSLYMTIEISEMLVRLNQMTEEQDETEEMLNKAFRFMGKEMVEMVKEMKKAEKKGIKQTFPSHQALQWLYICTLDGRKLPSDVQSANAYLIRLLKKETRNQSIYDKAMSAIILDNKTYIKSLKEYTVYREDMGRYYDTRKALYSWRDYRIPTQVAAIEAIKRLTPQDTKTIEEMQRWLLQEKRNQAWDTPINSADAVYAFLNGNSESLKTQEKTILKVDGKEIESSNATAGIGYVKTTMSGDDKQQFTAEKTSTGTSWGAVYMQFMQSTSEIEAQNSGISVKREILGSDKSEVISDKCEVGQRVIVRITIEADRDYDFVQVVDKRAACMEPVNQLSGYHWGYYCAPKDCSTNYYFDRLSKGKHVIETEYYIDRIGSYETGTCTASCAYSPEFRGVAKSQTIEVK